MMLTAQVKMGLNIISLIICVKNSSKLGQIMRPSQTHKNSKDCFQPNNLNILPAAVMSYLLVAFPYLPDLICHVLRRENFFFHFGLCQLNYIFSAVSLQSLCKDFVMRKKR